MSYNSNTILSCADPRILNLHRLSKISSDGVFDRDNRTSSHLVSNSWILSSWRVTENNRIVQYCIMSATNSKVVVDHECGLSSSKETVLFLGLLLLEIDLLLELRILDDLVQKQRQSSPLPSRSLENPYHKLIARINSSKGSKISTSLIHNIASDGKSEQVVTWFLNRLFHTKNDWWIREFVELQVRYLLSLLSDHVVLRQFHQYCRTRSQRPCPKCQHWNCALIFFCLHLCDQPSSFLLQKRLPEFPVPIACGTDPRSLCIS